MTLVREGVRDGVWNEKLLVSIIPQWRMPDKSMCTRLEVAKELLKLAQASNTCMHGEVVRVVVGGVVEGGCLCKLRFTLWSLRCAEHGFGPHRGHYGEELVGTFRASLRGAWLAPTGSHT